jgi:hypothetical protein
MRVLLLAPVRARGGILLSIDDRDRVTIDR